MYDESYFTVDGNELQQQSCYDSEDHPATQDVKFIRKTKFPAKVLLWLAVSESGISELSSVFQSRSCNQQRSVLIQMSNSTS
jgi:hypothetical protein